MKNFQLTTKTFADRWTILYILVPAIVLYVNITSWNQVVHMWNLWGLRVQCWWDGVIDRFGDDSSFNLYVYGMNIWNIVLFWTVGSLYLFMELLSWPNWLMRYKVQPTITIERKRLLSLIGVVLFNQLFVSVPFSILGYYVLKTKGHSPPIREVPTFMRLVIDIGIFIPVQEVFAYYTHRMFHHRLLYKWTHKIHHEWQAPIALSAVYNHPLDHLIGNIFPATVAASLTNSHFFTTWVWLTWATLRTLSDHSGYQFLTFPSPQRHDYHHLKFNECFGVWGPMDYLHGTETNFQAYLAKIKKKGQVNEISAYYEKKTN